MPGLDRKITDDLDWKGAIENVVTDVRSDFILSPHFDLIYQRNADKLVDQTVNALKSGRYNPRLPITMSVLKGPILTRPGSILEPTDRLVYQALVENAVPSIEGQMDRSRTFSHIPSSDLLSLFEPSHKTWQAFQEKVAELCDNNPFVLRADVANYFEVIPQHPLINLLTASGVSGEVVNLLEEMLLAFRQRSSFGIIQGVYPSDVLGNFYLSDFDGDCALRGIPSARYVDDIFAGFDTEVVARRNLLRIIERLRQNGLYLNPSKTDIRPSDQILDQEQEIDRLFDEAREEIYDEAELLSAAGYGFQGNWVSGEEQVEHSSIDLEAVRQLLNYHNPTESQTEKIHRFCLPVLRGANDGAAVEIAVEGFTEHPHLSRLYASYLTNFSREHREIVERVERTIDAGGFFSDYQRMYVLSAVLNADRVEERTVQTAQRWMEANDIGAETRAICAIFVAKHGGPHQKRAVRLRYENEPSEYVRAAILYAAQFFTTADRRSAKQAWGGQSQINALIGDVI